MSARSRHLLAAALGLCLAHPLAAQEPARLGLDQGQPLKPAADRAANQRQADAIAAQLRQSGQLHRYNVDILFRDGAAELSGSVADQPQHDEVLRIVQGVPGVERVIDRLAVGGVKQAQAGMPAPAPLREPVGAAPPNGAVTANVATNEPVPIFQAPVPAAYALTPPKMPPYAWPTYAAYNNFSRVAYPTAYPYNAWPFIGPIHPFPKVPLGWRSVKLEFEDGYWFFSKTATKYDWWRLRYW